jgi:plastocyanin domain-containing protein
MRLVAPAVAAALCFSTVVPACAKSSASESAAATSGKPVVAATSASVVSDPIVGKRVDVTVGEKGFVPASIDVKKGESTTLVFTRTTGETCATEVVFPELKIKRALPLKQPIAIQVPVGEAKTYGFECGMGMYKSKIVVQ